MFVPVGLFDVVSDSFLGALILGVVYSESVSDVSARLLQSLSSQSGTTMVLASMELEWVEIFNDWPDCSENPSSVEQVGIEVLLMPSMGASR